MFVGTKDDVADIYDARVMRWRINRSFDIYYEELLGGHSTFMVGKNMSYFKKVINLLDNYNNQNLIKTN